MRRLIANPKINPALKTLLNHVRPGFANIHARNLSSSSGDRPLRGLVSPEDSVDND